MFRLLSLTVPLCLLLQTSAARAQLLTGYGFEDRLEETGDAEGGTDNKNAEQSYASVELYDLEPAVDVYPLSQSPSQQEPVKLDADTLQHDKEQKIITASGDVFLEQDGHILRADEMKYNLGTDTVQASGLVVLNEENGDIHLVDRAEYNTKLRNGHVENLHTTLADGSRFAAETGDRKNGVKTIMHDASYTPCEPCENNPEEEPVWGLRASKVIHDQEEHTVKYQHARFEVHGVPVAYVPFFSHPDGTIKQKSGFLAPSMGYNSNLGAFADGRYYWGIAPDQDLTIGLRAMSQQSAPLGMLAYRKRWENARLQASGGITVSDWQDKTYDRIIQRKDDVRGHVFADGQWDINDKWRSGVRVNWSSDDPYLRQYDFSDDNVLENEIYVERFSGRNYGSGRLISYHDTRVRDEAPDQPDVLPEIFTSFQGEPGEIPLIKGTWTAQASALGLQREGRAQDMQRLSMDLGWKRRLVSDYGLLTNFRANVRGDAYYVFDQTSGTSGETNDTRLFPQLHIQSSYPVAKQLESIPAQVTIEPIAALTVAPKLDENNDIPNEDSNDVQIDTSNLFEPNRFPGLDRIEDQSRATYGLRSGLYGSDGSYGNVFIGQSYRFDADHNPFPNGSGLQNQESDIVGQISARYKEKYLLDYRFQYGSRNLTSQRQEVSAYADWNRFRLGTQYLYASALDGTDLTESREQINGAAQYYFAEKWRGRLGATHDLGVNSGLLQASAGLDYFGQCVFLSLTGQKNFTTSASGDASTVVLFNIGLKNLGGFEQSGYRRPQSQQSLDLMP
ncbi:MAG: LPS-assembly protein LptD [Alphaproteobacteria bacterium]|nr:LPS-assembly protein LptD [Alphaproteobacteria bacterium]